MADSGTMKTFAIIGAAGYIAPRHMKAIKEVGGDLVAAYDRSDSVGVLDRWFPKCELHRNPQDMVSLCKKVDYVVICTPNYRHVQDIMTFGDHSQVICEKPLAIDMMQIDTNQAFYEDPIWGHVNCILQLRLHPDVKMIKRVIASAGDKNCCIHWVSPRGNWYHSSWKGDIEKSGGILMNIGIHIFDLMIHLFGKPVGYQTMVLEKEDAAGFILFDSGFKCDYWISTKLTVAATRTLSIGDYDHDFTGFEDLHTESYCEILAGRGFGIEDARPSIELVNKIRHGIKL